MQEKILELTDGEYSQPNSPNSAVQPVYFMMDQRLATFEKNNCGTSDPKISLFFENVPVSDKMIGGFY